MLTAKAYSFRQKCRLAISLSWIGGYTNVVALLACGSVVSHVTGTVTNIGKFAVSGDFGWALFYSLLVAAFFLGTVVSALLLEYARRHGKPSKYVLPIALEMLLLTVFMLSFDTHRPSDPTTYKGWEYALIGLASMAMGIQNATITKISGAIVRTTHLTGVVTDFGLEGVQYLFWWRDNIRGRGTGRAGRMLRISQRHPTALRLLLLASIFGSFLFGVCVGAAVFGWQPDYVMIPTMLCLAWIIVVDLRTPIADLRELDLLADPELQAYGIVKALLPSRIGIYRSSCLRGARTHRAPDFQLWVDRLPGHMRVVILAINPTMRFDANSVMDLEAAVKKLHNRGRKLIIAGVTVEQYKALHGLSIERMMDITNLCTDLEFGIARGIAALHQLDAAAMAGEALPEVLQSAQRVAGEASA